MDRDGCMNVNKHTLAVLDPIVEAAREVLADMERDDIPAGLRKVARSSARTLPPPFARSVVQELARSDSFRAAVAQQYGSGTSTTDDLIEFLDDPEGGMERIARRGDASREVAEQSDLVTANRRIADLDDRLAEARRRTAALRTRHVHELDAARSSVTDGQIRAKARIERLNTSVSEKQAEIDDLKDVIRRLSEDLAMTEGRLGAAIERSRRRNEAASRSAPESRSDATPSDPLEMARWIDRVEKNARPYRENGDTDADREALGKLSVEPGVAPDSGSALVSLIEQRPRRFILDGYNIGGEISAEGFSTRSARDDVIRRAGRLARSTEAEVLVVFDGPDDEGRAGFRSSAGVLVRFSRGEEADDVIAALAASDPNRTVVVTNDRDLRDRCTIDGCVPIWSTAFLEWA